MSEEEQRKIEDAAFQAMVAHRPRYTLFILWITLAGLWQTGEVAFAVLRMLARLIA